MAYMNMNNYDIRYNDGEGVVPVRTDPLTGGSYDREHRTYTEYHGLSPEEADRLMECLTYRERDALFAEILAGHERDGLMR